MVDLDFLHLGRKIDSEIKKQENKVVKGAQKTSLIAGLIIGGIVLTAVMIGRTKTVKNIVDSESKAFKKEAANVAEVGKAARNIVRGERKILTAPLLGTAKLINTLSDKQKRKKMLEKLHK